MNPPCLKIKRILAVFIAWPTLLKRFWSCGGVGSINRTNISFLPPPPAAAAAAAAIYCSRSHHFLLHGYHIGWPGFPREKTLNFLTWNMWKECSCIPAKLINWTSLTKSDKGDKFDRFHEYDKTDNLMKLTNLTNSEMSWSWCESFDEYFWEPSLILTCHVW